MGVSDNLQDDISDENSRVDALARPKEKLEVKNIIELKNIKYKYPKTDVYVLNDASMEIPVGAAVGIVGTTGAGKSTIVDVMLGLLKLESGEILADGQDVLNPDNYRKWLKNIGYIPQTVFMLDASITQATRTLTFTNTDSTARVFTIADYVIYGGIANFLY